MKKEMDKILKSMTLKFFGAGNHKITPEKLLETENGLFLDVRSNEEAASISIKLEHHPRIVSKHIPVDELSDRMDEIPKDMFIGIFCPANVRSTMAYIYLLSKGFTHVRIIEGGYAALMEALKPGKIWKQIQAQKNV